MSVLDHGCLVEALRQMRDEQGRGIYKTIQAQSGVANIGRYARGEKQASFDTWYKLHVAFPDQIPAPCYRENAVPPGMVSTGNHNRLVQTSTYVENTPDYSPDLLELISIWSQYARPVEIKRELAKWRKIKSEAEKL